MHSFDSIIFDLDGTLWNTVDLCVEAWNRAIARAQIPFRSISAQDIASIMGLTPEGVRAKLFPELELETAIKLLDLCLEEEVILLEERGGSLYPGVAQGLAKLANQYPLFIVSNCETDYLETFLQKSGVADFFEDTECHGNNRLPKSENIKLIIRRNELKQPLYVGDTSTDERACLEAKLPFAFVSYGFGKVDNPDLQFASFLALTKYLLEK